jgi:DNA-binding NtrC family response regulator
MDFQASCKTAAPAKEVRLETGKSLFEAIEALERRMVQDALKESGGNKVKAAQSLGLSRQGLIKKLKKLERSAR